MEIIYSALYRVVKNGVPQVMAAPVDPDTLTALWQAQRVRNMAPALGRHGCTAFLYGVLTMSQSGATQTANGYGKVRDLDVGQFPNRPTRWGTALDTQSACAVLNAHGMEVLEDAVIHQYEGSLPIYELDSNGKVDKTLFPKDAFCFFPNVAVDAVFDEDGNYPDGILVTYQTSLPKGYMLDGVIRAMEWRRKRFGLGGFREDEAKGESVATTLAINKALPGLNFSEVDTGDPDELGRFVAATGCKVLDFTMYYAYLAVSNGASLRTLLNAGYSHRDPDHAIGYAKSYDTDGPYGIVNNTLWFYLHGLTIPQHAFNIYGGDYEQYNLAARIQNYMWISRKFAFGALAYEYVSDMFFVWSRNGDGGRYGWSGGLLCGINSDPINARSEWVHTPFAPRTVLHDYTGNGYDLTVNQDGWVYLAIGPNYFGSASNGVAYAPKGVTGSIEVVPVPCRQAGSLTDFSDF